MSKTKIFCFGFGQVAESFINKLINEKKDFDLSVTSRQETHQIEFNNIIINFENLSELKKKLKFEKVFLEASSHALDQGRLKDINIENAVFTNLTHDHLDYHETMDEYFSEKLKLFNLNKDNGSSVVMIDDEYGKRIAELNSNVKRISLKNEDADYFCTSYSINSLGIAGTLAWDSKTLDFESKLIGSFNLENLTLAASIAIELNISAQSIAKGIENCINIDGRLHLVENQKNQMIFLE